MTCGYIWLLHDGIASRPSRSSLLKGRSSASLGSKQLAFQRQTRLSCRSHQSMQGELACATEPLKAYAKASPTSTISASFWQAALSENTSHIHFQSRFLVYTSCSASLRHMVTERTNLDDL